MLLFFTGAGRFAGLDVEHTIGQWSQYQGAMANHFGFDQAQIKSADRVFDQNVDDLREYFEAYRDEITEYLKGMEKLEADRRDPVKATLPSFQTHLDRNQHKLQQLPDEHVAAVKNLWFGYSADLHGIRTPSQQEMGEYSIVTPPGGWFSVDTVDAVIPWFTLVVGGLLLLGLFTRTACAAGLLFLGSVMATQPPWMVGAEPTVHYYFQLVEIGALMLLFFTGAGRFAGLDYFLHSCCARNADTPSG